MKLILGRWCPEAWTCIWIMSLYLHRVIDSFQELEIYVRVRFKWELCISTTRFVWICCCIVVNIRRLFSFGTRKKFFNNSSPCCCILMRCFRVCSVLSLLMTVSTTGSFPSVWHRIKMVDSLCYVLPLHLFISLLKFL